MMNSSRSETTSLCASDNAMFDILAFLCAGFSIRQPVTYFNFLLEVIILDLYVLEHRKLLIDKEHKA